MCLVDFLEKTNTQLIFLKDTVELDDDDYPLIHFCSKGRSKNDPDGTITKEIIYKDNLKVKLPEKIF